MENPNMLSPLEAMSYVQQQGNIGRQNQLAQLASQAYTTPQDQQQQNQLLGKMAAINPEAAQKQQTQFQSQQQDHNKTLANMAHMLVLSPQETRAGLYQQMVPSLQRMGLNVPAQYDETSADTIDKTAQAVYQAYNGQKPKDTPSDIRTLQMLQSDPALLKLDMERRQAAGMVPKTVKTAEGYGYSTPGVGIQLAPMIGQGSSVGAPASAPATAGQGSNGVLMNINGLDPQRQQQLANAVSAMKAAGIPEDHIDATISQALSQAGADHALSDGAGGTPPIAQPYVAPMTDYQHAQLGLSQQRLEAAQAARDQAAQARKDAAAAKDAVRNQAANARQADAANSANQLIDAIDDLKNHAGFKYLGTPWGDAQLKTPLIRSDVKDANAKLQTISGQVALATMARLKALSPQGATGFGSLSHPELLLLQNAIATLKSGDISNQALGESLKTIRDSMDKVANWTPQGQPGVAAGNAAGGGTAPSAPGQSSAPVRVQTADDYNALPSGATYVTPDGSVRRKN